MAKENNNGKKNNKKNKVKMNKTNLKNIKFDLRFRNTIMSTIMFVMLIFIGILLLIHASITYSRMYDAQIQLPSQVFYNLRCMNSIVINPTQFSEKFNDENLKEYKNSINSSLKGASGIELVKNILIVNTSLLKDNKNSERENFSEKCIQSSTFESAEILEKYLAKSAMANKYLLKVNNINEQLIKFPDISEKYDIYMVLDKNQMKLMNYSGKNFLNQIFDFEKKFFTTIILISFILIYIFARSISKPLEKMEKTVSKIAEGDLSGRLECTKYDELNRLAESYNEMVVSLQRMYSTLERQVQERTQELNNAYTELQSTQAMMVHSEKMKSLGELVAGIMHEINNPINFIYGNMIHLNNYSADLIRIIDEYTKCDNSLNPEEKTNMENLKKEVDYEFLKTDLPDLIKSCREGADRAKNIIQDLKSFSRMEEVAIADVDLNKELDTVLNILHNKIKHKAEVHKEYDANNVPAVEAYGGQLNQVFMNILDNAVGAINEHGDIWVRMNQDKSGKNVIIEIEDNGIGMDADTAEKVFNPFFTTKPVGQGTGLGMSITYKIIKNHHGDIRVESKLNEGTKFIITLPINQNRDNNNSKASEEAVNG